MLMSEKILKERAKTHGDFKDVASTAQEIKCVMRKGKRWRNLSAKQREAFELIATKIARAVNGPYHEDDYDDIIGYATLGKGWNQKKKCCKECG